MAMEFHFKKGQRLVIELQNESFEGNYDGGNNDRIDLINVVECTTNVKVPQKLSFYRLEIVSVVLVKNELEAAQINEEKEVDDSNDMPTIQIPLDEYERLKEMSLEYIYMPTMDNRYVEATKSLMLCESVGVVGLGGEFGRSRTISLLVLSSWDQVYIFDLHLYRNKAFPPELRNILEWNSIKKIVHDSRALVDSLFHCHKVNINNIFDTQVADIMITKNKTGISPDKLRSISDCLTLYLNFPNTLLLSSEDIKSEKWDQRPLTDLLKTKAAQLSTYLFTLKVKFENVMLKNFNDAVKIHSTSVRDVNSCMALVSLGKDEIQQKLKDVTEKEFFS